MAKCSTTTEQIYSRSNITVVFKLLSQRPSVVFKKY